MLSSFTSVDAIIDDRLYIGNLRAATTPALIASLGITHILSVCPDHLLANASVSSAPLGEWSATTTQGEAEGIQYLVVPVQDNEYTELLPLLPRACKFIQDALGVKGSHNRVLVHCLMGVSRSSTVVAAYLMKTRKISHLTAISLIRQQRPVAHPNYGFRRQLQVFGAANYFEDVLLSPGLAIEDAVRQHELYIKWKRGHKRVIRPYLRIVQDTMEVIRDEVYVSSELPADSEQADSLLYDHGISHVLALSPIKHLGASAVIIHEELDAHPCASSRQPSAQLALQGQTPSMPIRRLLDSCRFINGALARGGQVLVYAESEAVACAVICAFMMSSKMMDSNESVKSLQDALPLFQPTASFTCTLNAFKQALKATISASSITTTASQRPTASIQNRRSAPPGSEIISLPLPPTIFAPHGPPSPRLSPSLARLSWVNAGGTSARRNSDASPGHDRTQNPSVSAALSTSEIGNRGRGQGPMSTLPGSGGKGHTHAHSRGHGKRGPSRDHGAGAGAGGRPFNVGVGV